MLYGKRFMAFVMLITMLLADVASALAVNQMAPASSGRPGAVMAQPTVLPSFPEDANRPPIDWAGMPWDASVTLPKDVDARAKEIQQMIAQGKEGNLGSLTHVTRHYWDDEVMNIYNVPVAVQRVVQTYRDQIVQESSATQIQSLRQALKDELGHMTGAIKQPDVAVNQTVDVSQPIPVPTAALRPADSVSAQLQSDIQVVPAAQAKNSLRFRSLEYRVQAVKAPVAPEKLSARDRAGMVLSLARSWFTIPVARAATMTPFIASYPGIENRAEDFALLYLSGQQHSDGSFGLIDPYLVTGETGLLVSQFNRTGNDQYPLLINYLLNTSTANNREHAMKIMVEAAANQPYQTLLQQLLATQNSDGGFGLDAGYQSDILSSLYVFDALEATNQSVPPVLYYLVNRVEADGAMRFVPGGDPSYYLVNKTIEALLPYRGTAVGPPGNTVAIDDKINTLTQFLQTRYDNATGDLLGTSDTVDYAMTLRSFQLLNVSSTQEQALFARVLDEQNVNGSFGASLRETIEVMKAIAQPDLTIISIQPQGQLTHGTPAALSVTIKNIGYQSLTQGMLYIIVDQFNNLGLTVNLASGGGFIILPNQQAVVNVTSIPTESWVGNTMLSMYVESPSEMDYTNNWQTQSVAVASNGTPAIPVYYIAHHYPLNGQPGINIRWPVKADPDRLGYTMLFREQGTTQWYRTQTFSNSWNGAFVAPFNEGMTYEVTAGVVHQNGTTITYDTQFTAVTVSINQNLYNGTANGVLTINNLPSGRFPVSGYAISTSTDNQGNFVFGAVPNGSNIVRLQSTPYDAIATKFTMAPGASVTGLRVLTKLADDTTPPVANYLDVRPSTVKNQHTHTIVIGGNDNIAIREGDLFYLDPQSGNWVFIAAVDFAGQTSATYAWAVPASLLGQGYRVRVIVRDYQGNESPPFEYGPFTILDGTLPTGAVTVEGLTNNEWILGEQKHITWTVSSTNPIRYFDGVYLHHGASYQNIFSSPPATARDTTFSLPVSSNYVTDDAYVRVSVCDVNYNCADFDSAHFAITDPTALPPPPWTPPAVVPIVTTTFGLERYIDYVAHDQSGDIDLLYREFVGQSWEQPDGQRRRLMYRHFTGGTWQQPVILKEYQYRSGVTTDADAYFRDIIVEKAGNANLHIVYQRSVSGDLVALDQSDIYYLHVTNGQVVSDQQISQDTTDSTYADFSILPNGTVAIVWAEGYSFANRTGTRLVRYRDGDGLNSWGTMQTLTSFTSYGPQIVQSGGNPSVMFVSDGQYWLMQRTGGAWSSPVIINRPDIARAKLDQYTADAARLPLIVTPDPTDNTRYLWQPAIHTRADLTQVLQNNGFVQVNEILNEWQNNEYGYNALYWNLFQVDADTFDLFYRQATADTQWHNEVKYLRFDADVMSGQRTIAAARALSARLDGVSDDVQQYRVAKNASGGYHVVYIMRDTMGNFTPYHPFHVYFDGTSTVFRAMIARPSMSVDYSTLGFSADNNVLDVYYVAGYGGVNQLFATHGDFGSIINYRITNAMPQTSGLAGNVLLDWTTTGGSVTSYDVRVGASTNSLTTVATGVMPDQYQLTGLTASTTYYWQVIGQYQGVQIPSNIFTFTTGMDFAAPTVTAVALNPAIVTQGLPTGALTALGTDDIVIAGAEYYILDRTMTAPPAPGSGIPMTAADGVFDAPSEQLIASVNTGGWTVANAPYQVGVRAHDALGNWSPATSMSVNVVRPSFASFSLDKTRISADTRDRITGTLVVSTTNAVALNDVNLIVNYVGQSSLPVSGYTHWDPTNGFQLLGGANFGADRIRLFLPNAASSSLGSERIVDPVAGTVTFKFRWAANPGYGNIAGNAVWYHFAERGNNFVNSWTRATPTFEVREAEAVVLIDKPTVRATGTDLQTVTYYIRRPDITKVDEVNLMTNYPWPGETNHSFAYLQWKPTTGFQALGGGNYLRDSVQLYQPNPVSPALGSEITVNTSTNLMILKFRFGVNPNYGSVATNTLSYHFAERTTPYVHFWEKISETYAVDSSGYLPSSLQALMVSSTLLHTATQEMQTATAIINTSDNLLVDDVRLIVNYPTGFPNTAGGYMQYNSSTGFTLLGGSFYGNDKIQLLPPNPSNPELGSQVVPHPTSRTVEVRFRWRVNPSYGTVATNNIWYWWRESQTGHTVPWRDSGTTFAVGP